MSRFKNHVIMAFAFGSLAVAGLLNSASTAGAQNPNAGSAPVHIVSPLPLPVTGSIGFAPDSSLKIGNPPSDPVLIRDVDAEKEPFQVSSLGGFSGSVGRLTL